jgi:hypothetical protein
MRWRDVFFKNVAWKLLALVLAIMIWYGAQNLGKPSPTNPLLPLAERTFKDVPIYVLAPPGEVGPLRLNPATAQVDVVGEVPFLRRIRPDDLFAFVTLDGLFDRTSATRRVEVHLPEGLSLLNVIPDEVTLRPKLED